MKTNILFLLLFCCTSFALRAQPVYDELSAVDLKGLNAFYAKYADKFEKTGDKLTSSEDPDHPGHIVSLTHNDDVYVTISRNYVWPVFFSRRTLYKSYRNDNTEFYGSLRMVLIDGELIRYTDSDLKTEVLKGNFEKSVQNIEFVYTPHKKPLLKTPADYIAKVQQYLDEKLPLQQAAVDQMLKGAMDQAEASKKEHSLQGKEVSSIQIETQLPETFGLGSEIQAGVTATLADGTELKTREIGGGTFWDDYEVTVQGGSFDAASGKITISSDGSEIKNDQLIITVKSVHHSQLVQTEKINILYNERKKLDFKGANGNNGRMGSTGKKAFSNEWGGAGDKGQNGNNGSGGAQLIVKATAAVHKQTGAQLIKLEISNGSETYKYIVAAETGLAINANGGNGGQGGDGGSGGDCGNANAAGPGKGGDGGNGGNGGNGGTIQYTCDPGADDSKIVLYTLAGMGGGGGSAGRGGGSNCPQAANGQKGYQGQDGTRGTTTRVKKAVSLAW